MLKSLKEASFYIGSCDDLECRMSKHFDGWSKYTASRRPWRLKYFEAYPTRKEAMKRERYLKCRKDRKYLEHLIDNWLGG